MSSIEPEGNKNILLTGASGMLGSRIRALFRKELGLQLIGTDLQGPSNGSFISGDLTDQKFLDSLLADVNPGTVIHCAALTDVDFCEKNRALAWEVHVEVSRRLARHCAGRCRMIYISTDSVFDGQKGNYTETDTPHPLNYYAETKYQGEKAVLANNPDSLVLRTNIYGFKRPAGKSLLEWALRELQSGKDLNGFSDVFFNPLYTGQLAHVIRWTVDADTRGILNAVSDRPVSKYEFLVKAAERFGFQAFKIQKKSIDDFKFTAPRPRDTTLDPSGLRKAMGYVPSLEDGLMEAWNDHVLAGDSDS